MLLLLLAFARLCYQSAGWKLSPMVGAVYGPEIYAGKGVRRLPHDLSDVLTFITRVLNKPMLFPSSPWVSLPNRSGGSGSHDGGGGVPRRPSQRPRPARLQRRQGGRASARHPCVPWVMEIFLFGLQQLLTSYAQQHGTCGIKSQSVFKSGRLCVVLERICSPRSLTDSNAQSVVTLGFFSVCSQAVENAALRSDWIAPLRVDLNKQTPLVSRFA